MAKLRYLIFFICLYTNPLSAVELGQLQVDSYINEPLSASLKLNDVNALNLEDIKFSLAGQKQYEKLMNMPRPAYLNTVKFNVTTDTDNIHTLLISTHQRVIEPIVNILLRVTEKQSSFFKKFTLFLDPQSIQTDVKPFSNKNENHGAQTSLLEKPQKQAKPVNNSDKPTITVINQSISIIAQNSSLHDRYSVYQIMRAFYLQNPDDFDKGNIDKLISGSILIFPGETDIAEVPRQKAISFVYSVSRDYPSAWQSTNQSNVEAASPATTKKPELKVTEPSSGSRPVAEPIDTPAKLIIATMQKNLQDWHSVVSEFSSLSSILESQNKAIQTQNRALQAMTNDLGHHEEKIFQLSLRLNNLESLQQTLSSKNPTSTTREQPLMASQSQLIDRQKDTIETINLQLLGKNEKISQLKKQLLSLNKENLTHFNVPLPEKTQAPEPKAIIENTAPQIITSIEEDSFTSKLWFMLILISVISIIAGREWIWHRRLKTRGQRAEKRTERKVNSAKPETKKPSTYKASEDTGEIELKDLNFTNKKKENQDNVVSNQSSLKLESNSIDEVKIEVDVLLAYEQYSEAMQLLSASREKFGQDPWLDIKELETLASARQCDEFFSRFDEKKIKLEEELPMAWGKIEKVRKQLCKEFKISAVQ